MKRIAVVILLYLLFLCGCSSNVYQAEYSNDDAYAVGYEEGYNEGYNDAFKESLDNPDYSDEIHSFQTAIAGLMYDHEYDTVRKLLEYNRRGVETALENEFGSNNIDDVIEYLDALSKTITGMCELCGEPVYSDELAILPEGISCAHRKCISNNNSEKSFEIQKDS
jgi:formylmethanofuran dehydrogenase subunit E